MEAILISISRSNRSTPTTNQYWEMRVNLYYSETPGNQPTGDQKKWSLNTGDLQGFLYAYKKTMCGKEEP